MSANLPGTAGGQGHETKDADVPSIALIGVGLILVLLLVQLTVWMTMRHLRLGRAAKNQEGVATVESGKLFPGPGLQVDPALDLAELRLRDSREGGTYGWIDRKAGIARIPIERAMQIIAERDLPDVGRNQTPLGLAQSRAGEKPVPKKRRSRY